MLKRSLVLIAIVNVVLDQSYTGLAVSLMLLALTAVLFLRDGVNREMARLQESQGVLSERSDLASGSFNSRN